MLRCTETLFDVIFTWSILYILFISDMVLTFINLKNLKKIFPKKYMSYEMNVFINFFVKKYGLKKAIIMYSFIAVILFTFAVIYLPIHANLVIGILIALVFLIHVPNYIWIKKRLKKKC